MITEIAGRIWNYIQNNQDCSRGDLCREFGIQYKEANTCIVGWAVYGRDNFVKEMQTYNWSIDKT